jgi:hypothetical protein
VRAACWCCVALQASFVEEASMARVCSCCCNPFLNTCCFALQLQPECATKHLTFRPCACHLLNQQHSCMSLTPAKLLQCHPAGGQRNLAARRGNTGQHIPGSSLGGAASGEVHSRCDCVPWCSWFHVLGCSCPIEAMKSNMMSMLWRSLLFGKYMCMCVQLS